MVLARCPEQTLIKSVLETAGPAFRGGEKFSYAIKQYLCLSLLKNGVSPIVPILQHSLVTQRAAQASVRIHKNRQTSGSANVR